MIVVTLFGTNPELEVTNLAVGSKPSIVIEDQWIALTEKVATLSVDRDLIKVHRREVAGKLLTWIGLYREVSASDPDVSYGYYGAGLWIYDAVVPGQLAIEVLVSMADQIKNLTLSDGRFVKKIAEIFAQISAPASLTTLLSNKKPLVAGILPAGKFTALSSSQVNAIPSWLDWAQQSRTAEIFNHIFIGKPDCFVLQIDQDNIKRLDTVTSAVEWAYATQVETLSHSIVPSEPRKMHITNAAKDSKGAWDYILKNWPMLMLVVILLGAMSMFALLWQGAYFKNKAYAKEITSLIQVQKDLRKQLIEKRN